MIELTKAHTVATAAQTNNNAMAVLSEDIGVQYVYAIRIMC